MNRREFVGVGLTVLAANGTHGWKSAVEAREADGEALYNEIKLPPAWTRPNLDLQKGTNIVHPGPRDSAIVWLDLDESDPRRRYKLFRSHSEGGRFGQSLHFSADGIHWGQRIIWTGSTGDRTTAFWNP